MRTGRPTKYTATITKELMFLRNKGMSVTEMCSELDIGVDTIHRWKKDPRKKTFAQIIKKNRLTHHNETYDIAYNRGADAAFEWRWYEAKTKCPYRSGTYEYKAWKDGFKENGGE